MSALNVAIKDGYISDRDLYNITSTLGDTGVNQLISSDLVLNDPEPVGDTDKRLDDNLAELSEQSVKLSFRNWAVLPKMMGAYSKYSFHKGGISMLDSVLTSVIVRMLNPILMFLWHQ